MEWHTCEHSINLTNFASLLPYGLKCLCSWIKFALLTQVDILKIVFCVFMLFDRKNNSTIEWKHSCAMAVNFEGSKGRLQDYNIRKNHPLIFDSCIKMSRMCIVRIIEMNVDKAASYIKHMEKCRGSCVVTWMKWARKQQKNNSNNQSNTEQLTKTVSVAFFSLWHWPNTHFSFIEWETIWFSSKCVFFV